MKHLNAFINESVSKKSASSMCTALLAKQEKQSPVSLLDSSSSLDMPRAKEIDPTIGMADNQ